MDSIPLSSRHNSCTNQRSVPYVSDDDGGHLHHPLIPSIHNCSNYDGTDSNHSADLLNTASDCFQAQDYNQVILLLEGACLTQPSSDAEAGILLGCALAYYKMDNYQAAAAKLRYLESMESLDARFLSCLYLGNIYSNLGDHLVAASYYHRAATNYTPSTKIGAMYHLQVPSLSMLYLKQGANLKRGSKIMEAIDAYSRAIETAADDQKDRLAAYTGLGTLHHTLGDCSSAVQQYTQALRIAEEMKDFVSLVQAHGNIGNAYVGLHQKDKALFHLRKSLDLALEHDPVPQSIGRAYNNLGTAYQALGELDLAQEYYDSALGQCIYGKDLPGQARAYGNIGNIAMLKKDYQTAIEKFAETLLISDDPAICVTAHHNKGCCLCEEARESSGKADGKDIQVNYHGPAVTVKAQCILDKPVQKLYEEALEDLQEVIRSYERTLHSVKGSGEGLGLLVSMTESNARTFHYMQDCLCALGRPFEALVYAEQSRARSLGELLLKKRSAEVSWTCPLTFENMCHIVATHNQDIVYLSYTGACLLVWVLSPLCGKVVSNMFQVNLNGTQFSGGTSLETFLHSTLSESVADCSLEMFEHCNYSLPSPLHPLHKVLVQPLVELLTAVHSGALPQEVTLIPDSRTLIPFAALSHSSGSGFLGDRLRFRVMPSLLVMGLMNHSLTSSLQSLTQVSIPADSHNFCIVGDPATPPFKHSGEDWRLGRLPHAAKEASWVAHILGSQALLGDEATKSRVTYVLSTAKLIHIATHGGRVSGFLTLAGSGGGPGDCTVDGDEVLLLPSEVEKLNIRAAIVVLSSCDSGRGTVRADGIIGMGRAFLLAGAQSVLTTLWRIPDESAGMFMQFFYQYLVDGRGTMEALQKATMSVRCFKKYSQYVHWGGFQLIGRDVQIVVERTQRDQEVHKRLGGRGSPFPRLDLLTKMEVALLSCGNRPSDVQILDSYDGISPNETVIDFIIKHHDYFKGGIFWVNGSSEHHLQGAEGVLLNILPSSQADSSAATKPLLLVLDNVCTSVTSRALLSIMRSSHTHLIVITSSPEAIQREVRNTLRRESCMHVVEPLSLLQTTQRLVYAIQSRTHFVPFNREQEMLSQLAYLCHGSPELVDAFSSLLLEYVHTSKHGMGLAEDFEVVLPKDVIQQVSENWLEHVSQVLTEGLDPTFGYLTPEDQLVLSSLSLFGKAPVPQVVADGVQDMIVQASSSGSLLERLKEGHLIKQYPPLCVIEPCASLPEQSVVLLHVPPVIRDAIWSTLSDDGKVMAVAVAHKALRNVCQCVSSGDVYLLSLCAGLSAALIEAAECVPGLTPDCYAQLYQPVGL